MRDLVSLIVPGLIEERDISFQDVFGRALDVGLTGVRSDSGQIVNENTALGLTAVWGCQRILSDNIARLRPEVLRTSEDGSSETVDSPSWVRSPAPHLRWSNYVAQIMHSLLNDGNAFVAVSFNGSQVDSLLPLDPKTVQVEMVGGRVIYRVGNDTLAPGSVLHLKASVQPAGELRAKSPIDANRDPLGLGLAAQQYGGSFFKNDATPSLIATYPGEMTPRGIDETKRRINRSLAGSRKSGSVAVLTDGMTMEQVSLTPEQAQFLGTRQHVVQEVCRIYGVPPHLLADASGSTSWGSGLAEQNTAFVNHTLSRYVCEIEDAHERLLDPGARLQLPLRELLSGDHKTRWDTHVRNYVGGLMSLNEIRALEGLPAVSDDQGGNDYQRPTYIGETKTLNDQAEAKARKDAADADLAEAA